MKRILAVAGALAVVLGIPFLLKPAEDLLAGGDGTLVVLTPHNEAIRYEFGRAFREWYRARTGRTVSIDWRLVGGTSEIARYLKSEYLHAFRREWEGTGRPWTAAVEAAFDNPRVVLSGDPADDDEAQAARRAFLASGRGIGVDLFFGGGAYDFIQQARAGRLVDCGVPAARPDWFGADSIPRMVSGEPFYDTDGRWIGTCLSSFGICYNTDSLRRLGITTLPAAWRDLTDPRLYRQVALADPTKSGSAAKAFEMVLQQQMQQRVAEGGAGEEEMLAEGWVRGLQLLQRAAANARYFTDAAPKVPMDVSLGDAAIGMCIDFYGRFQSEAVRLANGDSRLHYFTPAGGSSVGVDPIGLLRGAPHPELAAAFIEFVLSIEGQKLWNFRVGTPGGPARYALRRLPVRRELYGAEYAAFRSDPEVDPYDDAQDFTYHEAWTGPVFRPMAFIIRVMCLDTHDELAAAWRALIDAGFPPGAVRVFSGMDGVGLAEARGPISEALRSADRINEVRLAKQLGERFRAQYRETIRLAGEGR
jgi:ABC-type Fe3+ transport system substrate-binding protein